MTDVTLSSGSTSIVGRLIDTGDGRSMRSGAGAATWRLTGGTRVRYPLVPPAMTNSITVDVAAADVEAAIALLRGPSLVHVAATGPGIVIDESAVVTSISPQMLDYSGGRRITVSYEVAE